MEWDCRHSLCLPLQRGGVQATPAVYQSVSVKQTHSDCNPSWGHSDNPTRERQDGRTISSIWIAHSDGMHVSS